MGINLGRRLLGVGQATVRGLHTVIIAVDPPRIRKPWWAPVSVAVAVGAVAITAPAYHLEADLPYPVSFALATLVAIPLLAVATRPLLAWRIAWFGALLAAITADVYPDQPWPWHPLQMVVYLVTLWSAVTRVSRPATFFLWVFTVYVLVPFVDDRNIGVVVLLVSGLVVLADQVRRRREVQRGLAAQAERSELEQARRALLEERARIARELHDVVAHSMSLVVVRAETAPYRLTDLPASATEEFTGIATAARDALIEMRRLLGVLRSEDPGVALEPQPGLADLERLIATAREAGVTVNAEISGDADRAPASVQLTAYRIVQEALSNASRHAPGAPVVLAIRPVDQALEVVVRNGPGTGRAGKGERDGDQPGRRLGLRGMRERANLLGGSLVAGPADDDGFEVVAWLPIEATADRSGR